MVCLQTGDGVDHMETTNRPSRPDRLEIFWNDWGDRDDPDDHMETRLKGFEVIDIFFCKNVVLNIRCRYRKRFQGYKKISNSFLKFDHSLMRMPKIIEIGQIFCAEKRNWNT